MTRFEMEQEIKNLNARTSAIEQILPTLATKDDLRLTTEALQHEIETGFQDAKTHADRLNKTTREQIRLLAVATKDDMAAMKDHLHGEIRLVAQQMATKGDLQELRQELSKQFAALGVPPRNRKR